MSQNKPQRPKTKPKLLQNDPKQAKTTQHDLKGDLNRPKITRNEPKRGKTTQNNLKLPLTSQNNQKKT